MLTHWQACLIFEPWVIMSNTADAAGGLGAIRPACWKAAFHIHVLNFLANNKV